MRIASFSTVMVFFIMLLQGAVLGTEAGHGKSSLYDGGPGARYNAAGCSADALVDDVYSIYWNPAGLYDAKGKNKIGDGDGKSGPGGEDDLTNFSGGGTDNRFFQIGASYTGISPAQSGFMGIATGLFGGVFGTGAYYGRFDRDGMRIRGLDGSVHDYSTGYMSYATNFGITSVGISLKGLYKKTGKASRAGFGSDAGLQTYVLPMLKLSFSARDAFSYLYPLEKGRLSENRKEYVWPTLGTGAALLAGKKFVFSVSGSKYLGNKKFGYGAGIEYAPIEYLAIGLGFSDMKACGGIRMRLGGSDLAYAFRVDVKTGDLYNTVSFDIMF
ncbi:MAG: hypothetical protein MUD12_08095 [Spirochaetes bacterium]|jgi:hypothetical protein|nr:hypothetical protein [Spirochaetota bacterium]